MLSTIQTFVETLSLPSIAVGIFGYYCVTKGVPKTVAYLKRLWGYAQGAEQAALADWKAFRSAAETDLAALKSDVEKIKTKIGGL